MLKRGEELGGSTIVERAEEFATSTVVERGEQVATSTVVERGEQVATSTSVERGEQVANSIAVVLPGYERFVVGIDEPSQRVAIRRFPNGEMHTEVRVSVAGRRCVLIGSVSPPAGNLERVTLLAHTLRRAGADGITALLPYLAYARQDQAGPTGSLGLAWVGELLRASGVDSVVCVDVHSVRAPEVLGLPLVSLSPAELLAQALAPMWCDEVTFVAPDEGAIGRCSAVARAAGSELPIVWARKRRRASGIEHLGLVGSPTRRVVVVDDILDTGATLISCCRALHEAGVEEIGVIATHGLFTGRRWRTLLAEGVRRLWVTDTVRSHRQPSEAEVVAVARLLRPVLADGAYSRETVRCPI